MSRLNLVGLRTFLVVGNAGCAAVADSYELENNTDAGSSFALVDIGQVYVTIAANDGHISHMPAG